MSQASAIALGLDFGTESVRALFVDLEGNEKASAVVAYPHGQIIDSLPGTNERLPADFALQHPLDWIESAAQAVRTGLTNGSIDPTRVMSIGVDFTSCTMLPALRRRHAPVRREPLGGREIRLAQALETSRSQVANRSDQCRRPRAERAVAATATAGRSAWNGSFPKILETLENAPAVYDAAEVWLEAGDWFVWQLVGGDASQLPRSTCQAGYKGMWHRRDGFPSPEFFRALHPQLADVVNAKMPGRMLAPGQSAGRLTAPMAERFGLPAGIPVSAATIDAHAGVPGAGAAEPGTLVMVMGTSSCHMLNATVERSVPGVAGVVEEGILPGYFGYETGQAAVGDAFDWFRRAMGHESFERLTKLAVALAARSRRRVVHRLVQRLPHAADGRLAQGGLHGPHAEPRHAPLVPGPDGSLGLRTAVDCRHAPRERRAGRAIHRHRRTAASQSASGPDLCRRVGRADRRPSLEARAGLGSGHSRRPGRRQRSRRLRELIRSDCRHGRRALQQERPGSREPSHPTPTPTRNTTTSTSATANWPNARS